LIKALWLDNDASNLESYGAVMRQHGMDIDLEPDPERAFDMLVQGTISYDCLILDLRFYRNSEMPANSDVEFLNGFDFLEKMVEMNVDVPVCILSSFLQMREYQAKLQDLTETKSLRGMMIDKFIEDPTDDTFKLAFIDKILDFTKKYGPGKRYGTGIVSTKHKLPNNPFSMRYETFLKLSKEEQGIVREKAREIVSDILDEQATEGKIWVMFMGSQSKPFCSESRLDDIWSRKKVSELAFDRNRVPFQFRVNSISEDSWGCGASVDTSSYPKVLFGLQHESSDSLWKTHFDTGTYESHFSLEEFMERGMFTDYADLTSDLHKGKLFHYRAEDVDLVIMDGKSDETISIRATLKLVDKWSGSPFIAPCTVGCNSGVRFFLGSVRNCANRPGLIGRSFLLKSDLSMEYNPQDPLIKVRLISE